MENKADFCPAPRTGAFLRNPNTSRQGGEPCPAARRASPLFILPLPEHVPLSRSRSPCPPSPPLPCPPANLPAPSRRRGGGGRKGTLPGCFRPEKFRSGSRGGCCWQPDARCGSRRASSPLSAERPAGLPPPPRGTGGVGAARPLLCNSGAVISIHGRCIFFNATSLFQLVADSRIRFLMLFAFPVLWRIKIFVFLQSVPGRLN